MASKAQRLLEEQINALDGLYMRVEDQTIKNELQYIRHSLTEDHHDPETRDEQLKRLLQTVLFG